MITVWKTLATIVLIRQIGTTVTQIAQTKFNGGSLPIGVILMLVGHVPGTLAKVFVRMVM